MTRIHFLRHQLWDWYILYWASTSLNYSCPQLDMKPFSDTLFCVQTDQSILQRWVLIYVKVLGTSTCEDSHNVHHDMHQNWMSECVIKNKQSSKFRFCVLTLLWPGKTHTLGVFLLTTTSTSTTLRPPSSGRLFCHFRCAHRHMYWIS